MRTSLHDAAVPETPIAMEANTIPSQIPNCAETGALQDADTIPTTSSAPRAAQRSPRHSTLSKAAEAGEAILYTPPTIEQARIDQDVLATPPATQVEIVQSPASLGLNSAAPAPQTYTVCVCVRMHPSTWHIQGSLYVLW